MMRKFMAGIAVACCAVLAFTGTADAKKKGPKATTTTVAKGPSGYKIGETAKSSDFKVIVHGFQDPYVSGNRFITPAAGKHYIAVDVEMINPSKEQHSFSSLLGFHLVDAANRQYSHTITVGLDPGPPGGEIPAGGSVRGFVPFEIPDGSPGPLRLRVQGSLTASGAYFVLA